MSDYELRSSSYSTDDKETRKTDSSNNSASTSNCNNIFSNSLLNNTTVNTVLDISDMKLKVEGFSACDDTNMFVEVSRGHKDQGKTNFCFFCHKMQTKIVRHLESMPKDEEVKKFKFLPKGNIECRKFIDYLRRRGNFLYNIDPQFNTGNIITCRRPQKEMK